MKNKKLLLVLLIVIALLSSCFFNGNEVKNTETNDNNNTQEVKEDNKEYVDYFFKSNKLLNDHYNKHGKDMGFKSAEDYEKAASDVVNNSNALHKLEAEDNDDVYYIEATNEFVIVSKEGYIRTYFYPDAGKAYFDRQ